MELDQKLAAENRQEDLKVLRALLIDTINKANSGHPGMALDVAPALLVLYRDLLKASPKHPEWQNRDRFVLSSGHNSALLYSLLHIAGYDISMEDLMSFRQIHSRTPGHPEVGETAGVDATSGPLGQGIAQAVGMALAETKIRASYPEGERLCNHYTYCLCGDGCLEEGISQEAISFAGNLALNKLILIYDANGSTLDENTSVSMKDDVLLRFQSAHWSTFEIKDGNDMEAILLALENAKKSDKPSLILVHSQIGYGTKLAGSHLSHGAPLGEELGKEAKAFYGYKGEPFSVPEEVYEDFRRTLLVRGEEAYMAYEADLAKYKEEHPEAYEAYQKALNRDISAYPFEDPALLEKPESSRNASGRFLNALVKAVPFTFGGSADVASSVKTALKGEKTYSIEHRDGKNLAYGIREFLMAAANNGIALHKGLIPYGGSFLVFSDYMRNAIRMSALEKIPSIYLFSHDSIAVGEDGPTHEPIEALSSLRLIPGLHVLRPADSRETFAAWRLALSSKDAPYALILSRQDLPLLEKSSEEGVKEGAYLVKEEKDADYLLMASGSEVSLAIDVAKALDEEGHRVNVLSVPEFKGLEKAKEKGLLLPREKCVALEMGSPDLWYRYSEHVLGIERFGLSGKDKDLLKEFGFTKETALLKVKALLGL